jgi:transketolase
MDRTKVAPSDGTLRGAYVLADAPQGSPEILIMSTGAEVHLALAAYEKLVQDGISARVVSMPSWELFEEQDQGYQDEVLPPAVTARLAIEAGVSMGWERYVGTQGKILGIDRFGASAPGGQVLEKYGFTAEAAVAAAKEVLGRS